MFERTARDRRRPLSAKPAAIRQRKSRAKRRNGLRSFRLYLPEKKIIEAVKVRDAFPAEATPTQQQIDRALTEVLEWWSTSWRNLKKRHV
jgi:hypothetical protein